MQHAVTQVLELAVSAAHAAGRLLLDRFGLVQKVDTKTSATDPVSEVDRAAERLLISRLLAARPEDGVLGEEGGERPGTSGWRWVLDPLDGTVNYLYGLPGWCVSVACEERSADGWVAVAGVVHDPLAGETFTAALGQGAAVAGRASRSLAVNDPVPLEHALVATGFAYRAESRAVQAAVLAALLPRIRDVRRIGGAALDLCAVAAGRVDAYYENSTSRWDWAAGALIAAEAGAVVTPLQGPDGGSGLIVAGPALHPTLTTALTGARAPA
jgi:myo-inositol-1(or 4)-monophosphatase